MVFTPTDGPVPLDDWCLAVDRVRYAGEPVAAVAAIDRATAEDALERIRVTYEPHLATLERTGGETSGELCQHGFVLRANVG